MKLSAVVASWNTRERLARCLASLRTALEGIDAEVIVVDDASSDGSVEMVAREHPWATLVPLEENLGYAAATNRGVTRARGELLLLLNSDAFVSAEALRALVGWLDAHANYAGAAPRLVGEDGATQPACMRFPKRRTAFAFGTPLERWFPESRELRRYFARDLDHERDADVLQPPAACLMLRRTVWEDLGGFDEALVLFFNDVDLCKRLADRDGRLRLLARHPVVHAGGASTSQLADFVPRWQRDRLRYHRKHHGALGAACVKTAVTWTFLDWVARGAWNRLRGRAFEPLAPTSRAFADFLLRA